MLIETYLNIDKKIQRKLFLKYLSTISKIVFSFIQILAIDLPEVSRIISHKMLQSKRHEKLNFSQVLNEAEGRKSWQKS